MTHFLIIDDHPLFREALGNAIRQSHPDATVSEAMSIRDALQVLVEPNAVDLALLDLSLPDTRGFEGFLRLREQHPRLPVAIVSSHEDAPIIQEALSLGAAGFLPKSTSRAGLAEAIDTVLAGSVAVPKDYVFAARPDDDALKALRARIDELTPQQLRVLDLVRRGLQNKQIAGELKLAESTVKAHVTEILRKLNLFSRNKAVIEMAKVSLPLTKAKGAKGKA